MEVLKQLQLCKCDSTATGAVSLLLPPSTQLCLVTDRLVREKGAASNIKDASTRKTVQRVLNVLVGQLKAMRGLPSTGLAVYAGQCI